MLSGLHDDVSLRPRRMENADCHIWGVASRSVALLTWFAAKGLAPNAHRASYSNASRRFLSFSFSPLIRPYLTFEKSMVPAVNPIWETSNLHVKLNWYDECAVIAQNFSTYHSSLFRSMSEAS
jgi:hypothetical protein